MCRQPCSCFPTHTLQTFHTSVVGMQCMQRVLYLIPYTSIAGLSYQFCRHAMCAEGYVAVALCTHCRPFIQVLYACSVCRGLYSHSTLYIYQTYRTSIMGMQYVQRFVAVVRHLFVPNVVSFDWTTLTTNANCVQEKKRN